MIFQSGECQMCSAALGKIIKYIAKIWGNEENLAIFTIILMAAFGTKNVHSAMLSVITILVLRKN